ncbi:hypothetical protein ES332_A12G091400v1 [Gossypium tomentosum]|uniref:Uncharacterized protein n=1 Tax=Gossypium tomentosum TaxID=34277 RepID=A0A5D2MUN0_GOSTO|nr:hypothetical protein ES332_A12G091400v1 [Gossypium tomentosum]
MAIFHFFKLQLNQNPNAPFSPHLADKRNKTIAPFQFSSSLAKKSSLIVMAPLYLMNGDEYIPLFSPFEKPLVTADFNLKIPSQAPIAIKEIGVPMVYL